VSQTEGNVKAQTGEVLDGEKASTQEREKSGEAAGKYTEQALGLSLSSANTSCHQNF